MGVTYAGVGVDGGHGPGAVQLRLDPLGQGDSAYVGGDLVGVGRRELSHVAQLVHHEPPQGLLAFGQVGGLVRLTTARLGLLAIVTWLLFFLLSFFYPLTTDFSAWYAGSAIFSLSVIAGLAIYGFYTSLAGQSVFQGKLLNE